MKVNNEHRSILEINFPFFPHLTYNQRMKSETAGIIKSSFPTLQSKQAFIVGLLEKCPMNKSIDSCPAYGLRELPVSKKVDLVMDMDEWKLDELIFYHNKCMGEKAQ